VAHYLCSHPKGSPMKEVIIFSKSSLENKLCALALRHLRVHHSCRMVMVQSLHNAIVVMTRRAEPASQNLRQHAQHLGESLLIKNGRNMSTYNRQTFVVWTLESGVTVQGKLRTCITCSQWRMHLWLTDKQVHCTQPSHG
jgi:hypothetical protein